MMYRPMMEIAKTLRWKYVIMAFLVIMVCWLFFSAAPRKHTALIVTDDMRDPFVPGNRRAHDLSIALSREGFEVSFVSQYGPFAESFRLSLQESGIDLLMAPSCEIVDLVKIKQIDTVFLYL